LGEADIERLYPVYRACTDFCKLAELPFSFQEDTGDYETAIEFKGEYHSHPPWSEDWKTNPHIICPDILDYDNKIIIEFEEETGSKRPGARLARKGHAHEGDLDTKRDSKRNEFYKQSGFSVFRLWESTYLTENWKAKLFEFLINCWKKSLESKS